MEEFSRVLQKGSANKSKEREKQVRVCKNQNNKPEISLDKENCFCF